MNVVKRSCALGRDSLGAQADRGRPPHVSGRPRRAEALHHLLDGLGLRATPEQLQALLTQLTKAHASPVQVLEQWAALERREREVRNLASRTKKASVGTTKPATDYDWNYPQSADEATYQDLLGLGFMTRKQNVLFRGPAGVGKTMLAKNLGLRALERGHTVVFANLSSALADLLRQESLPAVERRLRRYTAANLVILDELGYQPVDARAVDLLFQIVSRRHEHASTILCARRVVDGDVRCLREAHRVGARTDRAVWPSRGAVVRATSDAPRGRRGVRAAVRGIGCGVMVNRSA